MGETAHFISGISALGMGPLKKERFLSGIAQRSSIKDERTLLSHHIQHAFIIPSYNFCHKNIGNELSDNPCKIYEHKTGWLFFTSSSYQCLTCQKVLLTPLTGWQGKARPVCKCQNNVRLRGKLPLSRVTPALHWGFVILTQLECYKYNIL